LVFHNPLFIMSRATTIIYEGLPSIPVSCNTTTVKTSTTTQKTESHHLFPWKLQTILKSESISESESIVSWCQHGRSFKVHDIPAFVSNILPLFFRSTKFQSFQRQLNLWGFSKIQADGPENGAYYHKYFRQDQPNLICQMKRKKGGRKFHTITMTTTSNEDTTTKTTIIPIELTTMTQQQEMSNPSSSSSSSSSSLSTFIEIPKVSTSLLNVNNRPASTTGQNKMEISSNELSTQQGFEEFSINFDMEYFTSTSFCHFEEEHCSPQQQYDTYSCCYEELELELDIQFKFTPTLTFEMNNQVQQETLALLKELKQEQHDDFSIPKMVFDTSDM